MQWSAAYFWLVADDLTFTVEGADYLYVACSIAGKKCAGITVESTKRIAIDPSDKLYHFNVLDYMVRDEARSNKDLSGTLSVKVCALKGSEEGAKDYTKARYSTAEEVEYKGYYNTLDPIQEPKDIQVTSDNYGKITISFPKVVDPDGNDAYQYVVRLHDNEQNTEWNFYSYSHPARYDGNLQYVDDNGIITITIPDDRRLNMEKYGRFAAGDTLNISVNAWSYTTQKIEGIDVAKYHVSDWSESKSTTYMALNETERPDISISENAFKQETEIPINSDQTQNVLTDTDKEVIGENASLKLEVKPITSSTAFDEQKKKYDGMQQFELNLIAVNGEKETAIHDTKVGLKITIPIPEAMKGKNLVVLRNHKNEATGENEITELPYTLNGNTITFYTDKFSEYALAYKDNGTVSPTPDPDEPTVTPTPDPDEPTVTPIPKADDPSVTPSPKPDQPATNPGTTSPSTPEKPATPETKTFTDVKEDAFYKKAVDWAVEKGITDGTGNGTTFSPNDPCTRAQMVTFLYKLMGEPKLPENTPVQSFADVKSGAFYENALKWAVANGITSGTSKTTFSPNETCTRAQMAQFLYKLKGSPDVKGRHSFTDVPENAFYNMAVEWLKESGITAGTSATTFNPKGTCTRAQMVTFLYKYDGNK